MTATYLPGSGYAVVTPRGAVLFDDAVGPDLSGAVWQALTGGGGLGEVLQLITEAFGASPSTIPAFAAAVRRGDGVHLAVRGSFTATVHGTEGSDEVGGDGAATWNERIVAADGEVELRAALPRGDAEIGQSGPDLALAAGVVLASQVRADLRDASLLSAVSAFASAAAAAAAAAAASTPSPLPVPVSTADESSAPEETIVRAPTNAVRAQALAAQHVFAAVDRPAAAAAAPAAPAATAAAGWTPPALLHDLPPTIPMARVRGARTPAPAPASPPVHPDGLAGGDHDGETVVGGRFAQGAGPTPAQDAVAAAPDLAPGEVAVLARACADGHVNRPEAPACSRCGGPLDGEAASVVRPPLGRVLFSTGPTVELDRSLVVGRKPRASRVVGGNLPRLVTVPSPEQDISRSHLEVRLEGWSVLLVDLGATNSTALRRPGQPAVRLHPQEPTLAATGDVVDLGDGVVLTFQDLP